MRRVFVIFLSTLLLATSVLAQEHKANPKKDAALEQKARDILKKDPDFIQVKVFVDDRIATLRGTVDKLSQRLDAEAKVRKVRGIAKVVNEIALFPAALPDAVLQGRLQEKLKNDFEGVQLEVHEGRVIATGRLSSHRARQRLADIIRDTDGVKEYQDRTSGSGN